MEAISLSAEIVQLSRKPLSTREAPDHRGSHLGNRRGNRPVARNEAYFTILPVSSSDMVLCSTKREALSALSSEKADSSGRALFLPVARRGTPQGKNEGKKGGRKNLEMKKKEKREMGRQGEYIIYLFFINRVQSTIFPTHER